MFCSKCGQEMPDNATFCPNCGADNSALHKAQDAANSFFKSAEQELGSAIHEVGNSFSGAGNSSGGQYNNYGSFERLNDNRGIVSYIILNFITCGIYGYYFIYKMAHDVNIACEGDGENTAGLLMFILLSIVTCGIYAWYWYYKLANRLSNNAPRYGLNFQENGTTVLMWILFGMLICGIGPYIAMYILIKNSNQICRAYNQAHGV